MDDPTLVVRQLINELRDDMSEAGRELRNRSTWDLQCPVVIIDAEPNPTGLFEPQCAASLVPSPPAT